jgi:hypothetical protein
MEQIDAFIEKIFRAEGERVTRDELIGRAEQAGLPHQADRLFQDLPPGPYTKEQLRAIVHEWMAKPGAGEG